MRRIPLLATNTFCRVVLVLVMLFFIGCTTMTPCERSAMRLDRGTNYFNQGNYKLALDLFETATELCNENLAAHAMKAVLYAYFGEFQKALNYADYVISLSPDSYWGYTAKGAVFEVMGIRMAAIEWQQNSCDMGNPKACEAVIRLKSMTDEQFNAYISNLDMMLKMKGVR
jgi:tetratricopeptide (TPR) repeat protein